MKLSFVLVVAILAFVTMTVEARDVTLKDGGIIECKQAWRKGNTIYLLVNNTLLEFDKSEIMSPHLIPPENKALNNKHKKKQVGKLKAIENTIKNEPDIKPQDQDHRINEAKDFFAEYIRLEHAFDPAIANLYANEAIIRNKRTYPTGQVRELSMPASKYKELLRASMPLAKQRGDTSTYTDISYSPERNGIRISADRYSELKNYHSPISILVKPTKSQAWLIYEEISESQP